MPDRPEPGPDQESVWDYPRPPALEPTDRRIRVVFHDTTIADTTDAVRVLETSHPPVYYLPPADVAMDYLEKTGRTTMCEFKGRAVYFSLTVGDRSVNQAAWGYPNPVDRYEALTDHLAFYASKMDACYVDDETVRHQKGDFYGGWITDDVVGPFKGGPGTMGW
jgi:uncharacterized protein (DUF427 family)